jgi:hypothetical protein
MFGSRLENLEFRQRELNLLLKNEFHPKRLNALLDKLCCVNEQIRVEKRKYRV